MKKIVLLFMIPLLLCCSVFSFSIVNPVEGSWANKQPLVIDLDSGEYAVYSLNGADPSESGFVYDSPVILDIAGDILLRVTVVRPNGNRTSVAIQYSVDETELPDNSESRKFISSTMSHPVINYMAGENIIIPPKLHYCFETSPFEWMKGTKLTLNYDSVIKRYLPCMVSDGNSVWRFIIDVRTRSPESFTQKFLPFEIENWDTVIFNDRNYIYKIDDEFWSLPDKPVKIDRNVPHRISWQDIDYSRGNAVHSFTLPPKSSINVSREKNGSVFIKAKGGYGICVLDENGDANRIYDAVCVDAFAGEHLAGIISVGYFYDSVLQAVEEISYNIDKKPPLPPVIIPDTDTSYSRKAVNVSIKAEHDATIFVSADSRWLSTKDVLENNDSVKTEMLSNLNYTEVPRSTAFVELLPSDSAVLYAVSAFAVDSYGNESEPSVYTVTIDTYNFYVSEFADASVSDGSLTRPFADMLSCIQATRNSNLAHISVNGTVPVPKGVVLQISNDCVIEGVNSKSKIVFADGGMEITSANVNINNCILSFENTVAFSQFIKLNDAIFSVAESEIAGVAGVSGVLIDASNSVVSIEKSGLTVSASNYASCMSCVGTALAVKDSRLASSSGTAVAVSSQNGKSSISSSQFYVAGNVGRVAEFFNTDASLKSNTFIPSLDKLDENALVFLDGKSSLFDDSKNRVDPRR